MMLDDTVPLQAVPISRKDCFAFITNHHRHHHAPVMAIFHVAVARGDVVVGVACCMRPVSRVLDDGRTLEVNRLCTLDDPLSMHAASKLYAICWRIAREMGYYRLLTYTMADESGVSLVAAGWKVVHMNRGHSWSHPSRPRVDKHPIGSKTLWEVP